MASTLKDIGFNIDRLWNSLREAYFGNPDIGKVLLIGSHDSLTLPGIYDNATQDSGAAIPDTETLSDLINISQNYLDAEKAKLKARLFNKIGALSKANPDMSDSDLLNLLDTEITKIFEETGTNLKTIVEAQTQTAKSMALLNGIIQTNAHFGIDDPTIVFLTTRDNLVCEECKRLHLMEDGITPRAYKLSEITFDYHKKGSDVPSIHDEHPNGRCFPVSVLPGYGYVGIELKYISKDFDFYASQH